MENSENSLKEKDSIYEVSADKTKNEESKNEFDDEYVYNPNNDFEEFEKTYAKEEITSETYNKLINLKIGKYQLLPIIGIVIGFILIVISAILFSNSSEKVIDNVASSELNVSVVIVLTIGLILIIISIIKLLNISHPFSEIAKSIDSVDNEEKNSDITLKDIEKDLIKKEKPTKSKNKYDINLKNKVKEENTEKLPNAKKSSKKKSTNEDYEKAKLETESIDDIFLDIDEK